jgi:regulator of sigma D
MSYISSGQHACHDMTTYTRKSGSDNETWKNEKIHFHGKIKGLYQRNMNYKCKYNINFKHSLPA